MVRPGQMSREAWVRKGLWERLAQQVLKAQPAQQVLKVLQVQQEQQVQLVLKARVAEAVPEQPEQPERKVQLVLKASRVKLELQARLVRQVLQDSKVKRVPQARRDPLARRVFKVQLDLLRLMLERSLGSRICPHPEILGSIRRASALWLLERSTQSQFKSMDLLLE
jgi:hypothetical protein